jgi:transcription termination factor Rho
LTVEETVEPKPAPRRRTSRARAAATPPVEEQQPSKASVATVEAPEAPVETAPLASADDGASPEPAASLEPPAPIDAAPEPPVPSASAPEGLTPEAIGEFLLDPRSDFSRGPRSRDGRRGRERGERGSRPIPGERGNGAERAVPETRDGRQQGFGQPRPRNNGGGQQVAVPPRGGPPHVTIAELEAKSADELAEMARELEIATFARLPRAEQMVRLLRGLTEKDGHIFGDGILEIIEDGFGFLRGQRFLPGPDDIYVSQSQIRRFGLRTGDRVSGQVRPPKDNEKFFSLLRVEAVNGIDPETARRRPSFDTLTPIFPLELINLETAPNILSTRLLNLVAPIGRGQRGLIVSPPKAGKTMLLKSIANGISSNCPDIHLMVCLIGERPEEVTDMRRSIEGEVISSTFDEPVEDHTKVAEMALERAKRLVEGGRDVVILLDSITRLARAYNLAVPPSGRTLSGGIDPVALYPPKRFFGAARNIEGGGSLTIVSTCLIDTGSRMDDVIYEEFKGTGNMELHLDRKLAERRIYPSIDVQRSGTRREELLLDESALRQVWTMRRMVSMLGGSEGTELLLGRLAKTQSNEEFLETLNRDI